MADKRLPSPDAADHCLRFGDYRVIKEVGRGGMGVVYQAVHVDKREIVALKVPVWDVSGHCVAGVRREIDALRRVYHPGIVRILDDGVTGGVPWMAMQFLEGPTLDEHLRAYRTSSAGVDVSIGDEATSVMAAPVGAPLSGVIAPAPSIPARSFGSVLTLIRRICTPLAFLHGKGLVHRDLKPANIFLQKDGRPVLADLGIAVHFGGASGREELDVDRAIGTLPYMAPEQIRGELVDARADLYALGCILYECVTGRTPFAGNTEAVIQQHLYVPPIPPSKLVLGLPPRLDDLILKLLEKHPQARIGHAAHVAAELAALGTDIEPGEGPPPDAHLYRAELLGRADVLATLEEMVQRVIGERRGGLALICGESGVGKTRLAREVARRAAQQRLATGDRLMVLTGSCVAPGAGEMGATTAVALPLHPLRPMLVTAAYLAHGSSAEAERLFGSRAKVLAPYAQELFDLPGQAEQPMPSSLPPKKARARVLAAARETLWALAEPAPLVILLDDLQWADDLTLSLLESLVRHGLDKRRVLIVGTYRSEETCKELKSLARLQAVTSIPLRQLDRSCVEAMVSGMLAGGALPQAEIDALFRHSSGNPFFVAEYLHAAVDAGMIERGEDGRLRFAARGAAESLSSLLPHTLNEILQQRLDRLDEKGQTLVAWAAVLGQDVDGELLTWGTYGRDAVMEALAGLKARRIFEETEEGQLRFVHDKIREIAYQRLADGARSELHERAGEALESRYAAAPDKAPALGHHFAGAGLHEKAFAYFVRAAVGAQEVYANGDAIRFYRAAIHALTRIPPAEAHRVKLAKLQESLGDVLALIGQQEDAREAYRAALDATSPSDRLTLARLHCKSGKTWEMHHQHAEALELYEQAEASLGSAPAQSLSAYVKAWWREWIQIRLDRVSVHYWKAEVEHIRTLVEEIGAVIKRQGTTLQRGHFLHALTQRNIQVERFDPSSETVRYARKCVTAYETAGEAREGHWVLSARFSLAFVLMLRGSLEEAEQQMADVLHAAQRLGDLEVQARCLTYRTLIHRRLRRIREAEDLAQRSLSLAEAEQVSEYAGAALGNLSWIALSKGNYEEAEQAGRQALSCWEPLTLVYPFQWLARLPLCAVAIRQGRLRDAVEQVRAVIDARQQSLPCRLTTKLEEAHSAFVEGHEDHAKRAILDALHEALSRGYA